MTHRPHRAGRTKGPPSLHGDLTARSVAGTFLYGMISIEEFIEHQAVSGCLADEDRHGNDGLGMELNEQAKRMMTDLAARLYHAVAFTAVEHESPDSSVRSLSMYYLSERFRRNNHPKYHKYCDEWIKGVTADQLRYFMQERQRIESGIILR